VYPFLEDVNTVCLGVAEYYHTLTVIMTNGVHTVGRQQQCEIRAVDLWILLNQYGLGNARELPVMQRGFKLHSH
jgi:hypothetical protein